MCPYSKSKVELTYNTPDTFNVEGPSEPREILRGGPCKEMYGDTEIEIAPNFDKDYVLMQLQLTVDGADSVKIIVRTQKRKHFPVLASEKVIMELRSTF